MSDSILDRIPALADLIEPSLLQELCARFGDREQIGVRIFDTRGHLVAHAPRSEGFVDELFEVTELRSKVTHFIESLKRSTLESNSWAIRRDPIASARYFVVPIDHEFDRIGHIICGPYFHPDDSATLPTGLVDEATGVRIQSRINEVDRKSDEVLHSGLQVLLTAIEVACHAGYRSLVTSHMHVVSTTDAYNELQYAHEALKEKSESLEKSNVRLQELDKVKSNFIATVSHELRTPLTSVIGYSEMLLEGLAGEVNEEQAEYIATIMERGKNLLEMISSLLDVSTVQRGGIELVREDIDLRKLAAGALGTVRPQALKRGQLLGQQLAPELPLLYGDRMRLRQCLVNLLSNAIKFTPDGGEITLRIERGFLPGPQDRPGILFAVEDTGIGIPEDHRERIFEAFYQVDNSATRKYGGAGLGLSLVQSFVEAHHGKVDVETRADKGTVFSFVIPMNGEKDNSA